MPGSPNTATEVEPKQAASDAPASLHEAEAELGSAADAVIDTVTATQQEALRSIETAGAAVLEGVGRVQREIADFVAERIRNDMDAQSAMLRCKTLGDLRSVQVDFVRTAFDQYSSEASRLLRLGGEMMTRSLDRGPN